MGLGIRGRLLFVAADDAAGMESGFLIGPGGRSLGGVGIAGGRALACVVFWCASIWAGS